jgi:hypothetical protein
MLEKFTITKVFWRKRGLSDAVNPGKGTVRAWNGRLVCLGVLGVRASECGAIWRIAPVLAEHQAAPRIVYLPSLQFQGRLRRRRQQLPVWKPRRAKAGGVSNQTAVWIFTQKPFCSCPEISWNP